MFIKQSTVFFNYTINNTNLTENNIAKDLGALFGTK